MIVSKRHERTGLTTRIARKITDIPADHWNRVFPDVLESYDFFKTLDESNFHQFSFFYIMVYDRKTVVGATACFLVNYSLDNSLQGPLRRLTNAVKRVMPDVFSVKAVVCGTPMGEGRIGIAGEAEAVMESIVRRMKQVARKNGASVVAFKDFAPADAKMLDPLRKKGFLKIDSLPSTRLDVRFKDFEDYLKILSGASRYDLRRKFRRVDNRVPVEMEITGALDEGRLQDVYRLYRGMVARHGESLELLPVEFFRNIPANMPGRVKYFLWKIDGRLVAFLLCLVSKDLFVDYYLGLDYTVAYQRHLYFIKFRDTLNWCLEHGIKNYEMGTSGYEQKLRLGFELAPRYLYVKHRNGALRPAFNLMCQCLRFENFDPGLRKAKKRPPS